MTTTKEKETNGIQAEFDKATDAVVEAQREVLDELMSYVQWSIDKGVKDELT